MIDGEAGPAILARIVALQMDGLLDGDEITCTLAAACMADALRKGETPRAIAEGLLAGVPSDADWNDDLRERITLALEALEEGTEQ